jgi:predicted nuclease of predicted toxin-antitoxin system
MQLSDYEYWIDANIPLTLATHLNRKFNVNAFSFYYLGLLTNDDLSIFFKAKEKNNVIIISKDEDFVNWVILKNSPPKILWITIGNVNNNTLFEKLLSSFENAIEELNKPTIDFIELN